MLNGVVFLLFCVIRSLSLVDWYWREEGQRESVV